MKKFMIVLFFIPIIIFISIFPEFKEIVVQTIKAQVSPPEQRAVEVARVEIAKVNIREKPTTDSTIIRTANRGQQFKLLEHQIDWMKIQLPDNTIGYITATAVSTHEIDMTTDSQSQKKGVLSSKIIVLDPGHGGNDGGTTGVYGTREKDLTLKTAFNIKKDLESLGAKVILTRTKDSYVDLSDRVVFSHEFKSDAFISLHYDSNENKRIDGITTFYYNENKDKKLGQTIHQQLLKETGFENRNVVFGNLQVIRDNERPSILVELGFLSNRDEELEITSENYQKKVSKAITDGLVAYFE